MMKAYIITMPSMCHYTLTLLFQNAKYFCTGCIDDESLYHHYAPNKTLYTHFTISECQVLLTGCIDDESLYHHYALNVPLYTHFTISECQVLMYWMYR